MKYLIMKSKHYQHITYSNNSTYMGSFGPAEVGDLPDRHIEDSTEKTPIFVTDDYIKFFTSLSCLEMIELYGSIEIYEIDDNGKIHKKPLFTPDDNSRLYSQFCNLNRLKSIRESDFAKDLLRSEGGSSKDLEYKKRLEVKGYRKEDEFKTSLDILYKLLDKITDPDKKEEIFKKIEQLENERLGVASDCDDLDNKAFLDL